MTSSAILFCAAVSGLIAMGIWGILDEKIDKSSGATLTGVLLFGAAYCGVSGHMVPEGWYMVAASIFVWVITLISAADWRRLVK